MMPRRLAASLPLVAFPAFAQAAEKGMPQLDFANKLLISQVVWLAIIFLALYVLLAQWGLPRVASVLAERARRIKDDLDAAHAAKKTADDAIAELNAAARHAHAEAGAAIAGATERAKREALAHASALEARLKADLDAAEARIVAAEQAAKGALREAACETAAILVTRLAGFAPDAGAVAIAVDRALASRVAG
ncbi:MAG: F0F1 ATP synthase subunit B' [Acidibrevibacterium sp.]|uniref:F0F1 ATP synthase subunit B family protein n=1 Tax=Acidibrevibacterium sp. TaxID=2606776 RepID=UPI003CFF11C1